MQDNKLNRASLITAVIGLLVFVVYATGIYLFTHEFTRNAVVTLAFVVIAFVCTFGMPRIAIRHPDVEAAFFGIPLLGFATYYFFAEIFVSLVFITFQRVLSFEVTLFVQLALFAAFLVIAIISFSAQGSAAAHSDERRRQAASRDLQAIDIQASLDAARGTIADQTLLRELEHLADTVRYADPFNGGHPAILDLEARIASRSNDLRAAIDMQDVEGARALVRELENLYKERASKLLLVK